MCKNCELRGDMFQFMSEAEKRELLRNHKADEWVAIEKMDRYIMDVKDIEPTKEKSDD